MQQLEPVIAKAGESVFRLPGLTRPALVTLNGVILQPADFSIEGEIVRLAAGVGAGDEVGAIVFG